MAATSLTWTAAAERLTPLDRARIELYAHAEALTPAAQDALDRFAVAFAAELLDSTVVSGATMTPEYERLCAAAYQSSAQHLEADKGRFESEGEIDGYETAVTMLEEYRDGAVRRGNRMVRS